MTSDWHILLLLTCLITLCCSTVQARDYRTLYADSDLKRYNLVYSPNIRAVLFEDMAAYLLADELATLQRVQLLQPWDRRVDPFEFSANAGNGLLLIPTMSVRFMDEMAIATAWLERFQCNKEAVFDYVAAMDYSDIDLPAMLPALNIPGNAYELDSYVDDVSQKALKSALAFILLHELGHVHHRHQPYDRIDAATAQQQEAQADQFAMRVLRRMQLPPLGMVIWFTAVSIRDPHVPGSPGQTHPLSGERLSAIANAMRSRPEDFIEPANRGKVTVQSIRGAAEQIDAIGVYLSDPYLRGFLRERGRLVTPELLAGACSTDEHNKAWADHLGKAIK